MDSGFWSWLSSVNTRADHSIASHYQWLWSKQWKMHPSSGWSLINPCRRKNQILSLDKNHRSPLIITQKFWRKRPRIARKKTFPNQVGLCLYCMYIKKARGPTSWQNVANFNLGNITQLASGALSKDKPSRNISLWPFGHLLLHSPLNVPNI